MNMFTYQKKVAFPRTLRYFERYILLSSDFIFFLLKNKIVIENIALSAG